MENEKQKRILDTAQKIRQRENKHLSKMTKQEFEQELLSVNNQAEEFASKYNISTEKISGKKRG